jgi:dihydroorotate dehydrogenase electron transfer subunit
MLSKTVVISGNAEISPGVFRLSLVDRFGSRPLSGAAYPDGQGAVADILAKAVPGQFVNVYLNRASLLLPRPFGISDVTEGESGPELVIVYAVVGAGTRELSSYAPGTEVRILGPQGNGYDLGAPRRRTLLVGGGLGIPPLLFAAHRIRDRGAAPLEGAHVTALLGYRDEPWYSAEMSACCDEVYGISESGAGSEKSGAGGMSGTVMDLIERLVSEGRIDLSDTSVLSCGPVPMLKAVAEWAKTMGLPAQVSLEGRMGCGYGACVGCTIDIHESESAAGSSRLRRVRRKICTDGPVFPADAVVW